MSNIFAPTQNRRYLFLDMNAYFAQCEQQANPKLRGRPVGVAPYTGPTGCVIASSYEAKRRGVKTGTLVAAARAICPEIVIVANDTAKYRGVHQTILSVLEPYGPYQAKSIDEIALPLWPNERRNVLEIARLIKKDLRAAVGEWLTCSIGIGPNHFYAKVATDLMKPDGLVEIPLEQAREVLKSLKLTDLPGINVRMERQLFNHGLYSPVMFFDTPIERLRQGFGILGDYWYLRLHGYTIDEVEFTTRTVGHSHVLAPKLRFPSRARSVLRKLVERAGERLRRKNFWARGVALSIDYLNGFHWHQSRKTSLFQDSLTFWEEVTALAAKNPYQDFPPLRLAVSAIDVVELPATPLSLFPNPRLGLSRAVDLINEKYGPFTVEPATLVGFEDAAPDRIPFGRSGILNEIL